MTISSENDDQKPQPEPEFIRLPAPRKRCPYTGLSRTTLCELVLSCPVNNYRPPVRSVLLKKRGAVRGIRLIDYDSLMKHLNDLADNASPETGYTEKQL